MSEAGWGVYELEDGYIVVEPINDVSEHDLRNPDCACAPKVEIINGHVVIIHNAFDFRHVSEWLNRGRRG